MSRLGWISGVISLVASLLLSSWVVVALAACEPIDGRTPGGGIASQDSLTPVSHDPIFIVGNGDFGPDSGVVNGSGTHNDPYIIQGWNISCDSTSGIYVEGTDAHLVVRDVRVHGDGWYTGMRFVDVANIAVMNCTVTIARSGLSFLSCSDILVSNCTISECSMYGVEFESSNRSQVTSSIIGNCTVGVSVMSSWDHRISENEIWGGEWGIGVLTCESMSMDGNEIWGCTNGIGATKCSDFTVAENTVDAGLSAIYAVGSAQVRMEFNKCTNASYGILFSNCTDSVIYRNNASNNDAGICLIEGCNGVMIQANVVVRDEIGIVCDDNCSLVTVQGNAVADSSACGILLLYSRDFRIFHNNIDNNSVQAEDHNGTSNSWDAGYPLGGNFWSNIVMVDLMKGANQDAPGSDGICDSPYRMIRSTASMDRYPLANRHIEPPVARATVERVNADASPTFVFDASRSEAWGYYSQELDYRWDWDDDGSWDRGWAPEAVVEHVFRSSGNHSVRLEVRDQDGSIANTTLQVQVEDIKEPTPLGAIHFAAIATGVAVVVLLALLVRRKRRLQAGAPPIGPVG